MFGKCFVAPPAYSGKLPAARKLLTVALLRTRMLLKPVRERFRGPVGQEVHREMMLEVHQHRAEADTSLIAPVIYAQHRRC